MEYDYNTVSGLGADECYLIGGDSGGPSFVDVNGQLALVGIHYYNGGTPGPGDIGPISGDSFVPYYINQLNANMGGSRVSVVVPEPASLALVERLCRRGCAAWPVCTSPEVGVTRRSFESRPQIPSMSLVCRRNLALDHLHCAVPHARGSGPM